MKFENKVIVITGGVRDIGKAISLKLAQEGAKLAINYHSDEAQGKETLNEVLALGGEAILVQGDMTKSADVDNFIQQTTEAFGNKIDVLVNVAGGLVARKTVEEMDEDFFNLVMSINLTTTFLLTKACAPLMSEGASIVNLSSQAARDGGGPGASIYAAAKGAVTTFTRSMAKELGPKGIRVNALCPGMISTLFHDTFTNDEARKNVANATALKREGRASEVADAVAYLASDESSFLNGVNVDINGGLAFS